MASARGDGLKLDVAALLLEVAELVGQDGRSDLDELAGDGTHQVLAIALFHEVGVLLAAGVAAADEGQCQQRAHGENGHQRSDLLAHFHVDFLS